MNVPRPLCVFVRPAAVLVALVLFVAIFAAGAGVGGSVGVEPDGERAGRPLAPAQGVWFEEVVTAPVSDWRQSGSVTSADEYIVLRNHGDSVDITGWVLHMIDGTDESQALDAVLATGEAHVVLNPRGNINNDVRLVLENGSGGEVDNVTLGESGVSSGTKADVFHEAVHLSGPWAGLRGPGTLGQGEDPLAAFWVSHMALAGNLGETEPFTAPWVSPGEAVLDVRIHMAPGMESELFALILDDTVYDLTLRDGEGDVWRSASLPVGSVVEGPVALRSGDLVVNAFPDASRFRLQLDDEPPRFDTEEDEANAFADADGRIHWFPAVVWGPSGLASVRVYESSGSAQELVDCVPLERPGPDCRVEPKAESMRVVLRDGAGHVTDERLPVVVLDQAPVVPSISFHPGPPPTLAWNLSDRPFQTIVVESAHNTTGAGPVHREELAGDARGFVDEAWEPGSSRAYRLVVTDRVGNVATGDWTALDPETVPVQFEVQDENATSALAATGEADVVLHFDRELDEPPRLSLRLDRPASVQLEAEGRAFLSGDSYSYPVRSSSPLTEGEGEWVVVGGKGADGAPVMPFSREVDWDHQAPHVEVAGLRDGWIQGDHHELRVTGMDGTDPAPVVTFTGLPGNVSASGSSTSPKLTVQGEGVFQVAGEVEDAGGNRAPFGFEVALDATAPTVNEVERPTQWSASSPLRLEVRDPLSGVDPSSLQVWLRNASSVHEAQVREWENDTAILIPGNDTSSVMGPFEVYLGVFDRAGNGIEGLLAGGSVRLEERDRGNETDDVIPSAQAVDRDGDASGLQVAPRFLEPPWDTGTGEQAQAAEDPAGPGKVAGASSSSGSAWDDFSWDQVGSDDQQRTVGWVLVAAAGLVGLGTAVHQVNRRRRKPGPGSSSAASSKFPGSTREPSPPDPAAADQPIQDALPPQEGPVQWETVPVLVGRSDLPRADVQAQVVQQVLPHWGLDCVRDVAQPTESAVSGVSFVVIQATGDPL